MVCARGVSAHRVILYQRDGVPKESLAKYAKISSTVNDSVNKDLSRIRVHAIKDSVVSHVHPSEVESGDYPFASDRMSHWRGSKSMHGISNPL